MLSRSRTELFIAGEWEMGTGEGFHSEDPATGEEGWAGNAASPDDVTKAIAAARKAFPDWAAKSFDARLSVLEAYRDILEAKKEDLAEVIARENGKPMWDARTEVAAMIGKIAISAEAYKERTPTRSSDTPAGRAVLRHRPHGVLAVFGPYNFPGHLPNGHIVPALLAGNTIVFKPSELTPAMGARMVDCLTEAGVPGGVINLVQGGRETGEALAGASDIDGLLFTGSETTGRLLHQQFAGQIDKIIALELGGNNPLIVHDVDNIEAAALITVQSAFITSGQRCTCARRLIVPKGPQGDEFIQALADLTARIETGAWDDKPPPFMGPLVSNQAAEAVLATQERWLQNGAKALVKVARLREGRPFLSPGLIDVTNQSGRKDEEIFGPLLQLIRVESFDAAIDEANNTRFGLAAGLLSNDGQLWEKFLTRARAGIVNWNKPLTGASSAAPFGGIGMSGNHRPSAYYAADYTSFPMASMETSQLEMPPIPQGIRQ